MKTYTKTEIEESNPNLLIGKVGQLTVGELDVDVSVKDVRHRFGHIDLLVKPISGSGDEWVEKHRITFSDKSHLVNT